MGWLAPVIIRAKMLLQTLWIEGQDWDDQPTGPILDAWTDFREQLLQLQDFRIPRWFEIVSSTPWELHVFCDASERAYAAVAYLVHRPPGQEVSAHLIAAKTKVSPIKVISTPRLELCGALLGTKLLKHCLSNLKSKPENFFMWSDSKVVLDWLRGHPSQWKTFVANRVSEIILVAPASRWHHVSTEENPADCASRGLSPEQLLAKDLWWHRPKNLLNSCFGQLKPTAEIEPTSLEKKERATVFLATNAPSEINYLAKHSSLSKIIRILSYCLRWRQPRANRNFYYLTASELNQGRRSLLMLVQQEAFAAEIGQLKRKHPLSPKSHIFRLLPFIGEDGLLRISGRLQHAGLSYGEKHPIILPKDSFITRLLVEEAHKVTLHGGAQLISSFLHRSYWIVQGGALVRSVVRRCPRCVRLAARHENQLMAPLPEVRVKPSRPFSHTGLDYAGPVSVRTSPGRGHKSYKGYIAIFICMCVKAVHVEIVSNYSSEAFLAAFRRFVARRGLPSRLYSDNGTTFRGADAELQRLFQAASAMSQEVGAQLAGQGVQWSFIPPKAPHFGGLWEASVKSFKHHLVRAIGEQTLTFEELSTVAAQVEACLNSRPLCPLSTDPNDVVALTPGHFLMGESPLSIPEPFDEIENIASVTSRWKRITAIYQSFWRRWHKEVLHHMQQRAKWFKGNTLLKEGDLVIIKDSQIPPLQWPLARVTKLHTGPDGLNRVATVKTSTSEFCRPLVKLIHLPLDVFAKETYNSSVSANTNQGLHGERSND